MQTIKKIYTPNKEELQEIWFVESVISNRYYFPFVLNKGYESEEETVLIYCDLDYIKYTTPYHVNWIEFYPRTKEELITLLEVLKPD